MIELTKGRGGVIAIDKDGNFGLAFNTTEMIWASMKNNRLKYGTVQPPAEGII
jgi:isoaspartyl peptidase/L-asparaginase-like protein (Ntn-hydrolase superfamily)